MSRKRADDSEASQRRPHTTHLTMSQSPYRSLIYSPCRHADRQQHPAAHRPGKANLLYGATRDQKSRFIYSSSTPPHPTLLPPIPPKKKSNANSTRFNLFSEGGENKSSSQHKQTVRCGGCSGHFTQIKLVCIKQALCVRSSI